ncbi:MAG: MotA/TolQ/ExbB proton channel family protein [Verrucomicrobiae bacterium]|nr:MotA/TolQ/ExbB proton channel family protein [Verrucomicrobiae bacterium]
MTLLIGWGIVVVSVIAGFMMAGGKPTVLIIFSEYLVVGGCAVGFAIGSSPVGVLKLCITMVLRSMKGSPYSQKTYTELVQMMYEIFVVGRQQGLVGVESHVLEPENSPIVSRFPSFLKNKHALEFFMDSMKPVIDGKLKADQLKSYLDAQLVEKDNHAYAPIGIITKVADACPALGIVAAVLGIIITMGKVDGPIAEVGMSVAHALVGTFLGVFLGYGILQPLAANIEFANHDELAYYTVIRSGIVAFASGASPLTAAEYMRSSIPEDRRIGGDTLESLLKSSQGAPR